ncbi:cytoplasmic protein [Salmonella enterica]|nr:cytoplasmic protein [Salmonella enterica subsp. enterica serovar Typhimurium]EDK2258369.1 cytoplasmic protein [Salmonella enterica subsp. enterica serovar Typhimurium]
MLQKKTNPMIKNFNFEYCGFSTFITPVDGVGGILVKWLSNKHNVIVPTPYTFGQDPIPGVNLYRNTKAKFVMANGGNSLPCAMAKYNTKTGQFTHITSDNDFSPIIRETRVMKK